MDSPPPKTPETLSEPIFDLILARKNDFIFWIFEFPARPESGFLIGNRFRNMRKSIFSPIFTPRKYFFENLKFFDFAPPPPPSQLDQLQKSIFLYEPYFFELEFGFLAWNYP